jgi:SAM-dependent methyltransferase
LDSLHQPRLDKSRHLVTNQAIINAALELDPESVLDIRCGEGWLVRELASQGIDGAGIDAVPEFVNYAAAQERGQFQVLSYEELPNANLAKKLSVLVCNFPLLGDKSVATVFRVAANLLAVAGTLLVTTLHPANENKIGWQSRGGWRQGFNEQFKDPAQWYFRRIDSWLIRFQKFGFSEPAIKEQIHSDSSTPVAIIFSRKKAQNY